MLRPIPVQFETATPFPIGRDTPIRSVRFAGWPCHGAIRDEFLDQLFHTRQARALWLMSNARQRRSCAAGVYSAASL